MPFLDFNHGVSDPIGGPRDFTIVGAGAAGIFLAARLAEAGRSVLLVESGHFGHDEERQKLNDMEFASKSFSNARWNRKRILGGTTTAWGGQSLPFKPLDFARRDWVEFSGWPITYEELAPWYREANAFMGVDGWNYDSDLFGRLGYPAGLRNSGELDLHFSKWAPRPNFMRLAKGRLRRSVDVLYNAHVLELRRSEGGKVSELVVGNFAHRRATIPVATLILAGGGIETTRTLLLAERGQAGGFANQSGWLGRGFMEHPSVSFGRVLPGDMLAFHREFAPRFHRFRKYSVRLSASENWQISRRLLNATATLQFNYPSAETDPFEAARRILRGRLPAFAPGCRSLVRNLSRIASRLALERIIFKPGCEIRLALMIEQEPARTNRLTLGDSLDAFMQPRARLNWEISDLTAETAVAFAASVKTELEGAHSAAVRPDPPFDRHPACNELKDALRDVNHHMGGTRMSSSPEDGVVDPNLRLWSVPDCFICSCSVFPTSSHSNPTLTMLALGARLAGHLLRTA